MELMPEATTGHAKEACYLCLNPSPVVDLGVVIEGEGFLALCPGCLAEAMTAAGRRLPTDPLVLENGEMREALAVAMELVNDAEDMVITLANAAKRVQERRKKDTANADT